MRLNQLAAEGVVLIGLLSVMVYLPVVTGDDPVSDRSVLLFAVGWVVVRTIALSAGALRKRHSAKRP